MLKKHDRHTFLIGKEIQNRIAKDLVLTWIVGVVLVYAFPLTVSLLFGMFVSQMPMDELLRNISKAIWMPLLTAMLVIPIGIRHSIRFSNRIAGPMYRFETELGNLLDGKPVRPIHLRNRDFFHKYAQDFNQLAALVEENGLQDYRRQDVGRSDQPTIPIPPLPGVTPSDVAVQTEAS